MFEPAFNMSTTDTNVIKTVMQENTLTTVFVSAFAMISNMRVIMYAPIMTPIAGIIRTFQLRQGRAGSPIDYMKAEIRKSIEMSLEQ